MNSPAEESRRCWTLHYADDVLIPHGYLACRFQTQSYSNSTLDQKDIYHLVGRILRLQLRITPYLITVRSTLIGRNSNPKGYAAWFRHRMETQFNAIRKSLAESIQRQVEDVPEYKVKTPLQRSIQILKRHRDIWFDKNQSVYGKKAKPISIIITTLAAHAYDNEVDLQQALLKIVKEMPCHIEYYNNGVALIRNPVNPLENFADKWQEYPIRKTCFMEWLKQAQYDLTQALELSDIQSVGKSLKPCLGEQVINEGLRSVPDRRSRPASTLSATVIPRSPYAR